MTVSCKYPLWLTLTSFISCVLTDTHSKSSINLHNFSTTTYNAAIRAPKVTQYSRMHTHLSELMSESRPYLASRSFCGRHANHSVKRFSVKLKENVPCVCDLFAGDSETNQVKYIQCIFFYCCLKWLIYLIWQIATPQPHFWGVFGTKTYTNKAL